MVITPQKCNSTGTLSWREGKSKSDVGSGSYEKGMSSLIWECTCDVFPISSFRVMAFGVSTSGKPIQPLAILIYCSTTKLPNVGRRRVPVVASN